MSLMTTFIFSKVYAQVEIYNLYSCNPVQIPPPYLNFPTESLMNNLFICGLSAENAQQSVNEIFSGLIRDGWSVNGQCSIFVPSYPSCKQPGRL